jgi:hypothetical protein
MIKRVGKKYQVAHCHGSQRGKPISKPTTRKKAAKQHRAIQRKKR